MQRAAVAGFVATCAMTLVLVPAYFVALSLGAPETEAPRLQRWLWGLANNALTRETRSTLPGALGGHFVVGIAWAFVYAALAEPRLAGPAWRRGTLFSLAPWVLSLLVFFPAVGAGVFGAGLGAGPLPVAGNLILHLVYGAVLGAVYAPSSDRFQTEDGRATNPVEVRVLQSVERSIALGIVAGLVLGGVLGFPASLLFGGNPVLVAVLAAVGGSLVGASIGSFRGLRA